VVTAVVGVVDQRLSALPERLRAARARQGWTLEQAAQRSGLSVPHLSRLESGGRQPSIAVLVGLAAAYGEPVGALLGDAGAPRRTAVVRAADAPVLEADGLTCTSLTGPLRAPLLQALRVTVPAGRGKEGYAQHPGEEWLFVRAGRLRLDVDGDEAVLAVGDAAHFDAAVPHRLATAGRRDAEVLLVAAAARVDLLTAHR
jgi:transcriptional regulator with XRE-family HTH domain